MSCTVMVAVRGDEAETHDALALGVQLAQLTGAQLVLASISGSPLGSRDRLYEDLVRDEVERELTALEQQVPAGLVTATEVRGARSPARGLQLATERHVDVLVVGPSHVGQARRAFSGDIALDLVHDAPCAVAVAPTGWARRDRTANDVALAWDGSKEADLALELAVSMTRRTGGRLRIVNVFDPPYLLGIADAEPDAVAHWMTKVIGYGDELIAEARREIDGRVPSTGEVRQGLVAEELAEAAAGCAMLVVGSRAHGALARLVVGSTTAAVLASATVPVLVMPRGATASPSHDTVPERAPTAA